MRFSKNNLNNYDLYSTVGTYPLSKINLAILLNFFKEAFLLDYLYKASFYKFTGNYLLKQNVMFNFSYLNNQQTFYMHSVLNALNSEFISNRGLLGFFTLLLRAVFVVTSVIILISY